MWYCSNRYRDFCDLYYRRKMILRVRRRPVYSRWIYPRRRLYFRKYSKRVKVVVDASPIVSRKRSREE